MVPTEQPERAAERSEPEAPRQEQGGIDFSRYRMNPVEIEESKETARAVPRRISVFFLVLLIIAGAVMTIVLWNRQAAEVAPPESLDPAVRERAQEFTDNVTKRIQSLQGYVYDVDYKSPTEVDIFISPSVLDKSGAERAITDEEVQRATERVVKEFRGYAPHNRHLTVRALVVEHALQAENQSPVAIGTYDPDTDSTTVKLTAQIPMPKESGAGEAAPPGEGHLGAQGDVGPR